MKILKSSQGGLALFVVIFVMAFFLVIVTAGLFFSGLELKKTANFKLAVQALEVADAGLQHALANIEKPFGWDFNNQLTGGSPAGTVISPTEFPLGSGSGFTYTVTAQNDPPDTVSPGSPTNDTNNIIILTSKANGPNGTEKVVQAYVRRSLVSASFPSALYINGTSASPAVGSYFFSNTGSIRIIGNDTNANDLLNASDDTAGAKPSLWGIATTNSTVTNALRFEYLNLYPGVGLHDILGVGTEPSIGTTTDLTDVDKMAQAVFNNSNAVKYLNGLQYDATSCPSSSPCQLGTSANPQITYIKQTLPTDVVSLKGDVRGYGALVLEGAATIGGNFRFYGVVLHKRSAAAHTFLATDTAWVYGGVLLGSYEETVGVKKVRFTINGNARIFYSSQAISSVNNLCGSCLPQPSRVFAWLDQ